MANIENLTETSLERFALFIKFLSENNLVDDAVQYLNDKGYRSIQISVEPIREVQKMLQERLDNGDEKVSLNLEKTRSIIMSGHQNSSC